MFPPRKYTNPVTIKGRTQAYSVGNKVYGGGRSNPTSGTVDKTGYRERDAMKAAVKRRLMMMQQRGR